jgi:ATP-dependent HslUV protease ATP-binding subunit HslU
MEIKHAITPPSPSCAEIVADLDRYIVGQAAAKRAVAIALRNRWRRLRLPEAVRREVVPNNIIMIGPTGVGKTEIARRLAQIAGLPFLKAEASKFTERGYVGRDVDSLIRDLVENGIAVVRQREEALQREAIDRAVEERLVDLLFPPLADDDPERRARWERSRDRIREQLRTGVLEDSKVSVVTEQSRVPIANIFTSAGEEFDASFGESLKNMFPKQRSERVVSVAEARRLLGEQESTKRLNQDQIVAEAITLVEQGGIVFLDEIDKIAGSRGQSSDGPDVSREGVQRDLLPIVEGATVSTKYGPVRTDHVLFIAAGAFHQAKPSDLIPELQGRFPVRVELDDLTEADFVRILRDTDASLLKQYRALLDVDNCQLTFTDEAVAEMARLAAQLNTQLENIGARRLQTILAQVLDDILYDVPQARTGPLAVDGDYVRDRLKAVVKDQDLSRYIL